MEILTTLFSIILMVVGLAGIVLPFLPGLPLVWLGFFIYAFAGDFQKVSLTVALIFLGLTVILMALDFLAPLLGAKRYKASKYGLLGAFLGSLIGIFTLGPLGIILGPFCGAFLGELVSGKEKSQAFGSALGAFLGFIVSALSRLILALVIIGFFIASFF